MRNYFEVDDLKLRMSGREYFDALNQLITESKEILHFQTYIFEEDETGKAVANALIIASQRGVKVFLMIDAVGSKSFSNKLERELMNAGIQFRYFSPLFSSENIHVGRRLHHKIIVADKYKALVGGINIANKYNDTAEGRAWLDFAIYTEGRLNEYLHLLCEQFYRKQKFNKVRRWEKLMTANKIPANGVVRYASNDWIRRKNSIHISYSRAVKNSKTSLIMVASYFLPGRSFRRLLSQASKRGVTIKLIVAGRSDLASVRLAENYLYAFYLKNNIQVYEWVDSVMHGKAMVVDGLWATVGSYNLNFLSQYASIELNAEIKDETFVKAFDKTLNQIAEEHCSKMDLTAYSEKISMIDRFLQWLLYTFFRFIKLTMTYVSKRRKSSRR